MTLSKSMLNDLEQNARETLAEIKEVIIFLQYREREIKDKLALARELHDDCEKSISYWANHPDRYREIFAAVEDGVKERSEKSDRC